MLNYLVIVKEEPLSCGIKNNIFPINNLKSKIKSQVSNFNKNNIKS
jgi:hypothetical protein